MTITDTYLIMIAVLGIGLSIRALELVSVRDEFRKGARFDFIVTGSEALVSSRWSTMFERLYSRTGMAAVCALGLGAYAGLLLVDSQSGTYSGLLTVLILSNLVVYYRQAFGLDGADQMSLLILITVFFCFVVTDNPALQAVGLWFIGLQLALAYLVSGVAKLVSREWRSGVAISGILSTYTYGTSFTRRALVGRPRFSRFVAWSVIATEIGIPLGLLGGVKGVAIALGVGLAMHLSIALIMGLNDFVWGFTAAYPAFVYLGMS